jgi:hypothetical protein
VPTFKKETSQINNLIMHLKLLDKQEQTKPQNSIWRDITKTRAEVGEIETKTKPYKESVKAKCQWLTSVILALRRQRSGWSRFKTNLGK